MILFKLDILVFKFLKNINKPKHNKTVTTDDYVLGFYSYNRGFKNYKLLTHFDCKSYSLVIHCFLKGVEVRRLQQNCHEDFFIKNMVLDRSYIIKIFKSFDIN